MSIMKLRIIYLLLVSIILFACSDSDELYDTYNIEDLQSLEGMSNAIELAEHYNDSLEICHQIPQSCDIASVKHYDEMFHYYEDQYNYHHSNYSHNNVSDDHHHANGQRVRHGWMMGDSHVEDKEVHGDPQDNMHPNDNEQSHGYEHNMQSMDLMNDLIEHHQEVHPK